MAWNIKYFQKVDGSVPAVDFEDSIPEKMMAKLHVWLESIAESEGKIGGGRFEKCHGLPDLWEVRVRLGYQLGRELCTRDGDSLILLHGFVKPNGTPSPPAELNTAMVYLEEYRATKRVVEDQDQQGGQH